MQNQIDAKDNGNVVKLNLTTTRTNSMRRELLESAVAKLFPKLSKESPTFTRLVLCMEELTVNATKKEEQFPVEITLSKEDTGGRNMAKFTVKDSGKPFELPIREEPLKTKGHGIGLTLVDKITKQADGEWGVDGTTNTAWFTYKMPPEDRMD